jgi:hypothetical protein
MVIDRIEGVALEPAGMIDQRPVAAQFLDKDPIAQPLRGQKIGLVTGQADLEPVQVGKPRCRQFSRVTGR